MEITAYNCLNLYRFLSFVSFFQIYTDVYKYTTMNFQIQLFMTIYADIKMRNIKSFSYYVMSLNVRVIIENILFIFLQQLQRYFKHQDESIINFK